MKKIITLSASMIATLSVAFIFALSPVSANAQTVTCPAGYVCTNSDVSLTVIGTPTLVLTYDSGQKESLLKATFTVSVYGGSSGVNIYKSNMSLWLTDQKGVNYTSIGATGPSDVSTNSLPINVDGKGNQYYTIPAASTTKFSMTQNYYPQKLFAGVYTSSLQIFATMNGNIPVAKNSTNAVTIIGETSPYIIGFTTSNVAVPGQQVVVTGQRLQGTVLFIDGIKQYVSVGTSNNGTQASFVLPSNIVTGGHTIQLQKENGMSNGLYLLVQSGIVGLYSSAQGAISNSFTYTILSTKPFSSVSFTLSCTKSQVGVSTKGGGNCGETINIPVSPAATKFSITYDFSSLDGQSHVVGMNAVAYTSEISGAVLLGSDKDAVTVVPSAPTITVVSPNGGENLIDGKSYFIQWDGTGAPAGSTVSLQAMGIINGVESWGYPIYTNLPALSGSTSWVPRVYNRGYSEQFKIKASILPPNPTMGINSAIASDESDAVFTVSLPSGAAPHSLKVTSPSSGASVASGSQLNIKWSSTNIEPNETILLTYKLASSSSELSGNIITLVPNTGSYIWSVPSNISGNYILDIFYQTSYGIYAAENSQIFTITPPTATSAPVTITENGPGTVSAQLSGCSRPGGVLSGCWTAIPRSVVFTAQPSTGATFSGWGGACASAGSAINCAINITGPVTVVANFVTSTLDLGSKFPAQATSVCPAVGLTRSYTVPAFTYDVNIVAQTSITADDNLTINGTNAYTTTANTYCKDIGKSTVTNYVMNVIPAGTVIRKIPKGTPITLTITDAVGVNTSGTGTLKFVPLTTASLIDDQAQTAAAVRSSSIWDAIVNFFSGR